MSRRWLLILGIPLLLVLLAAGALVLFRSEAVTWLLQRQLAAIGYPDARFTVADVGLHEVVLTDVTVGPAKATRVVASFDPLEVVSGKLQGATVTDLVLTLDLTGAGPVLPGLGEPATMTGTGVPQPPTPGFNFEALPPLTLVNAQIAAETLIGPVTATLDGDIRFADAKPTGSFAMTAAGPLGAIKGSLAISLEGDDIIDGAAVLESGYLDLPGGRVQGLAGELDFRVGGDQPPRLRSELSLTAIELKNRLFDTADLLVVLEDGQFVAEGKLRSPDRKAEATFKATADQLLASPVVAGELSLKLEAGAALWPLLGVQQPSAGEVTLRAQGDGTLQPIDTLSADTGGIPGWLAGGSTRGRLDLQLVGLSFEGAMDGLDGHLTVDWGLLEGLIVAGLPQDAKLTVAHLDPGWLSDQGLPTDTAIALSDGLTLDAPSEAAADPRIYLQPSAEGHLLDLAGTFRLQATSGARAAIAGVMTADLSPRMKIMALAIQGLAIQAQEFPADGHVIGSLKIGGDLNGDLARMEGPLALQLSLLRTEIGNYPVEDLALAGKFQTALTPERLELAMSEPGTISASQVLQGAGGPGLLPAGAKGAIASTTVAVDWSEALEIAHDSVFTLEQPALSFGAEGSAVPVTGDFGRIHLVGATTPDLDYVGTLDIEGATIHLAGYGLTLGGTTVHYIFTPPGEATPPAELNVAKGSITTGLGTVGGMALKAQLVETDTTMTLTGEGRGPGGLGKLVVKLTDDSSTGKGGVNVDWGPVTFKADGTQPGSIIDYFGDFKKFSGGLKVALKFAWTATSDSSLATVTLTDAAFEHPQATVTGLNTKITFDRLARISTPAGQTLTAKSIDVGVPLTDVSGTFRIQPGKKGTVYALNNLAFGLFGGRMGIAELKIDPAAAKVDSTLEVADMDLGQLAAALAGGDFRLEGRMTGRIPFSYTPSDETVTISGGRLTNTTPGAIKYGQPGTAELRSGGDENFTLALQALENFQYSTFDLTINKGADGKARLGVTLEGKNPEVLDGFPFKININLQTDLTEVLTALRDGYKLNPDLFKGGWDFQ